MAEYTSIFIKRPNNEYMIDWHGVVPEYRSSIAFYSDVFCLIGLSVLGMTPQLLDMYREVLESKLRNGEIKSFKSDALELIQSMNNNHHKQAVLARYPFTGFPTTPRNTFEIVGTALNITAAGAENIVKKGIQDLRVMSDVRPLAGIFTIPGFSKLNPSASKKILS